MMQRLKAKLQVWMIGRNGVDRLSQVMMWVGIGLLVAAMLFASPVVNLLALVMYVLAILRVFSKNVARRRAENRAFVNQVTKLKKAASHRRNRHKNRKQYRYFKCPNCKAWLRVPRGAGQVKVTCGKCENKFSYIAK